MLEDKYKYINSLVIKCKAGDNESIFELYEFYRPLMLSSISRCIAKEPKLSVYKEDILADSIFVFILSDPPINDKCHPFLFIILVTSP